MRDDDSDARVLTSEAGPEDIPVEAERRVPIQLPLLDDAAKGIEPPPKTPLTSRPIFWIGVIVLIAAAIGGWLYYQHARQFESTDDAFIDAHIVRVAPQIAGILQSVPAVDNAHVNPGDLLAVIEPAGQRAQFAQAGASVAQAEGALAQAQAQREQALAQVLAAEATRRAQLANVGVPAADAVKATKDLARYVALQREQPAAIAEQTIDQARAAAGQANAQVAAAQAVAQNAGANIAVARRQVRAAEANVRAAGAGVREAVARRDSAQVTINNLRLFASVSGHVAHRTANVGTFVSPGTQIMAIVPDQIWVTANFKETQLRDMRVGQHVDLKVDALPQVHFEGHVDSFQRGAGQAFELLPPENATGNYVKVVQRVPVRIVFDRPNPLAYPIGPGMSVTPRVKVR
jgi:membrane fusion protein (multidrug efflux system)